MAAYAVTDYVVQGTPVAVAAALETYLETVDDSKTIRIFKILGDNMYCTAILIHDA